MKKLLVGLAALSMFVLMPMVVHGPAQSPTMNPASVVNALPTEDGTTPMPTQRPPKVPVPPAPRPPKIPAVAATSVVQPGGVGANIISSPNFPPGWVVRLHQWSWFSSPPATYDFNIIQFMDWKYGGGGLITQCIDMSGTGWDNTAMAVSMNAPGQLNVYAGPHCSGSLTTQVNCITSADCRQSRTCDYANWGWRTGWWANVGGSPICATGQWGQPTSIRWGRYNAGAGGDNT